MKIALIYHSFVRSGGKESYLFDLVRGLKEAGDDVHVYARLIDRQLASEKDVEVRAVGTWPVPRVFRDWMFSSAVDRLRLKDGYDRVISLANVGGQDVHIGGTHIGYLRAMGLPTRLKDRAMLAAERRTFAAAPTIVTHSKMVAAEVADHYGVPAARLKTLYPPVDTVAFSPLSRQARAAAREKFGLDSGLTYFLFPSMGHYRKGLDIAAAAFAGLADLPARLLIAGRPGGAMPDNVRSLGYVTDMAALYNAVDCTLLPTRYEPFGLVITESLQCGTPVIVSRAAGVAEILDKEDGALLPDLEVATLRSAILAFVEKPWRGPGNFAVARRLTLHDHVSALRAFL